MEDMVVVVQSLSCVQLLFSTMDSNLPGSSVHGKNTRVGGHFFLQGSFSTQGWNLHLLHWQENSTLNHQESMGDSRLCEISQLQRTTTAECHLYEVSK